MPKTPQYRIRSGYSQAIVTLTDAKTKKRRDYWLGEQNSPESREKYHVLIAAWEANGRCFPDATDPMSPARSILGANRTLDVQMHSRILTRDIDSISGMRTGDVSAGMLNFEGSVIHLTQSEAARHRAHTAPDNDN